MKVVKLPSPNKDRSMIDDNALGIINVNGKEPSVDEKFAKHREIMATRRFPSSHRVIHGDARKLTSVVDSSVHAVITSPPYFNLIEYHSGNGQLGNLHDYNTFLDEMDCVWRESWRVLIPGGKLCVVVGDVCRSRKKHGHHEVVPLHADLLVRLRKLGFNGLATIFWLKIANATTEVGGAGAVLGKPYEPNGVVKNDVEFILRLQKPGPYRKPTPIQRAASLIPKDEFAVCMKQVWSDIPGASRRSGHPAPFPVTIASRLIRMSSYIGDTILDPFLGSGTTTEAAMGADRNSIGFEIDADYLSIIKRRFADLPFGGAVKFC